ncbi:MAG TPA: GatB/YqeY domain-containing protein [Mariprofundaceae bacterium]|nr:GatB/YqeY domain-containing protein [Mariprofundaceae bacterium]
MLVQQITDDMKAAMKAGDKARLAAIRMLRAAIKDREIELGHALDDAETQAVVAKLVKQRNDAANQYQDAGRADLEAAELAEAALLQAYLPEPLSDAELAALIDAVVTETGAAGMRDMGKVMAAVKERAEGRADMGKVSGLVKARLS